jgi:LuxR family maltose regulon positive regulatory protein
MAEELTRNLDPYAGAPMEGVGDLLPLVEAKLALPRQRPKMVERPRLLRALYAAGEAALTLVAAPPGYGKTTAVRAWCARQPAPVAWLTLDAGDNDPVRLWWYLATAVDRVHQGLGRQALRRLSANGGSIESPVDELLNRIAASGMGMVLVLDDLQSLSDADSMASIDYALEHLPPTVRMITMTRTDPALRIPQLRVQGALAELRASDLAFTKEEACELVVEQGPVDLEAHEVATLCERTAGWPAALSLATLWLRNVDDPHTAVREFGGDHHFVADYLSNEVITALDDDARTFLLRASVLGRFTAELCDGVLERGDSASVLTELERSNLFVERLDHGGWSRVHPLFAEFAGFQLASVDPGALPDIHLRAAGWLRSRGLADEAARHAAAAGDYGLLADLLEEYHLALIRAGGARTLLRWARTLPDEQLVEHPVVAAAAAAAAAVVGAGAVDRSRFLRLADRAHAELPGRSNAYARAIALAVRAGSIDEGVSAAVEAGRQAVEVAEGGADEALLAALACYARALYMAGDFDEAWTAALQAIEHPDAEHRPPGHAFARTTLALVAVELGRLTAARIHAEKAKSILGGIGSSRNWLGANASAALGAVLAGEGNLVEAERQLAYAERLFQDEVASVHHAWLLTLLARTRCRRGRLDEAAATLRSAREAIGELVDSGRVPSLVAEVGLGLERAQTRAASGEILEPPSDAELAVLRLLATDLSARQIGGKLFLSLNTVRSHTRALYHKLGVSSRSDAVARARTLGLLGEAQSPM